MPDILERHIPLQTFYSLIKWLCWLERKIYAFYAALMADTREKQLIASCMRGEKLQCSPHAIGFPMRGHVKYTTRS